MYFYLKTLKVAALLCVHFVNMYQAEYFRFLCAFLHGSYT